MAEILLYSAVWYGMVWYGMGGWGRVNFWE